MIHVALFGPPGAGKGLQSELLVSQYPLMPIAPGVVFRREIAKGTPLGKQLDAYIRQGNLAPETIVIETVNSTLQAARQKNAAQAFLFDGYPRSEQQAAALDAILTELGTSLGLFIVLAVDVQLIQERLTRRGSLEGRSDDAWDKVNHRLKLYEAYRSRVLAHYEPQMLVHIDGEGTPEQVNKRIRQAIDRRMGTSQ